MEQRQRIGYRAQRTGLYAESKFTHWRPFRPSSTESHGVFKLFSKELTQHEVVLVRSVPLVSDKFIMPVSEKDVADALGEWPPQFLKGLQAVFLLGGSHRQAKASTRRLFAYGAYGSNCIWLYPFPVSKIRDHWSYLPKPSLRREYERAGAVWEQVPGGWDLVFSHAALRTFYLRDVLIHEIGHHIDRTARRNRRSSEAFADWVASSVGFGKTSRNI